MRYTVTAQRGTSSGVWVLQCEEVPGAISQTRKLSDVEMLMREAIAFVAEVAESDVEVEVRYELQHRDALELVEAARQHRRQADELAEQAADEQRKAAWALHTDGISLRDIGVIMGVSYQRAHQLVS